MLDQTETEELEFPEQALIIDFCEGVKLLEEQKIIQDPNEDINSDNERLLGEKAQEIKAQGCHGFSKQPVPSSGAGGRFFKKQLFSSFVQLMGLVLAQVLDPWAIACERSIVSIGCAQHILV